MNDSEFKFRQKIKNQILNKVPSWVSTFVNVDELIDQNMEALIDWLRKEKKQIQKL